MVGIRFAPGVASAVLGVPLDAAVQPAGPVGRVVGTGRRGAVRAGRRGRSTRTGPRCSGTAANHGAARSHRLGHLAPAGVRRRHGCRRATSRPSSGSRSDTSSADAGRRSATDRRPLHQVLRFQRAAAPGARRRASGGRRRGRRVRRPGPPRSRHPPSRRRPAHRPDLSAERVRRRGGVRSVQDIWGAFAHHRRRQPLQQRETYRNMPAQLDAFGVIVDDMPRSLAFYRELGIELPPDADEQPHVEAALAGGLRLLFDTVETIRSFDPDWQPPPDGAHRLELAFGLDTPAEVDDLYARSPPAATTGTRSPGTRSGASATRSSTTPTATASPCSAPTAQSRARALGARRAASVRWRRRPRGARR